MLLEQPVGIRPYKESTVNPQHPQYSESSALPRGRQPDISRAVYDLHITRNPTLCSAVCACAWVCVYFKRVYVCVCVCVFKAFVCVY